jgi:hypothetical protein
MIHKIEFSLFPETKKFTPKTKHNLLKPECQTEKILDDYST